MSYMSCGACKQLICIKSPKQCVKCSLFFHAKCDNAVDGVVKQVINISTWTTGNTSSVVCRFCQPPKPSKTLSANASVESDGVCSIRPGSSQSSSRSVSPLASASTQTDVLHSIISKLDRMEQVQSEFSKSTASSFVALESRLAPLEGLQQLVERVDGIDSELVNIRAEQENMRGQIDTLSTLFNQTSLTPVSPKDPTAEERMNQLELTNRALSSRVEALTQQQGGLSSEIVISGIYYNETTVLRKLVFAVLNALDDTVLERDIISVRPLRKRANLTSAASNSRATDASDSLTASGSTIQATATDSLTASESTIQVIAPEKMDDDANADKNSSKSASPRCPPLAVSLATYALARSLIETKIKRKNLHTSQLTADLLVKANIVLPLQGTLINVNELLPAATHRLRIVARTAAKKLGHFSFVRDGKIYLRKKNERKAVHVTNEEEVNNFLG